MDSTLMTLAWDLPSAVSVRHRIDPHSQVLTRTVSDVSGVLEQEQVQLEHACVSCALREDVLRRWTGWRATRAGRASSPSPLGTEAQQLAHALGSDSRLARHLQLSSVVAAVGGDRHRRRPAGRRPPARARRALEPPRRPRGRGGRLRPARARRPRRARGRPGPEALDLVRAIARPGVPVVTDVAALDVGEVATGRHHPVLARTWCDPELDAPVPDLGESRAWRLDLRSARPFTRTGCSTASRTSAAGLPLARHLLGPDPARRHARVVGRRRPAQHRRLQPLGSTHPDDPLLYTGSHAAARPACRLRRRPRHPDRGRRAAALGRRRGRPRAWLGDIRDVA